jgi:putative SOS response-associated peptidase YedK
MCGRYTQTADARTLAGRFRLAKLGADVRPRWNMAPGQDAPVVVLEGGRRWGSIAGAHPAWAKDPTIRPSSSTPAPTPPPTSSAGRSSRRCLVPTDGYYSGARREGQRFGAPLLGRRPFAFAGLWASGLPEGGTLRTFTVLTTEPNALVAAVHDRMPVILTEAAEDAWLDPGAKTAELKPLLVPYDASGMRAQDASTRVNAVRNDDPSLLTPDEPLQPELGL